MAGKRKFELCIIGLLAALLAYFSPKGASLQGAWRSSDGAELVFQKAGDGWFKGPCSLTRVKMHYRLDQSRLPWQLDYECESETYHCIWQFRKDGALLLSMKGHGQRPADFQQAIVFQRIALKDP